MSEKDIFWLSVAQIPKKITLGETNQLFRVKQITLLFGLVAVFSSCSSLEHEVELVFENISESTVTDLRFYTTDKKENFTADALDPGEETSHSLAVANYSADGEYTFQFVHASGDTVTTKGNYFEKDYIKNTLTFKIVNEGVEVENKIVRREENHQANAKDS